MSNVLPYVFERADKLLLLGVPYLASISILYYAGYWGLLSIDVYNYFAVSDLIKGAAYPMQLALAVGMMTAAADWFLSYVLLAAFRRKKKLLLVLFAGALLAVLGGVIIWQSSSVALAFLRGQPVTGPAVATLPLLNVPAYVVVLVLLFGGWATGKILPAPPISAKEEKTVKGFRLEPPQLKKPRTLLRLLVLLNKLPERFLTDHFQRYALALALLTTPFFAFASGYYQARGVLAGKRFDYVERPVYQEDHLLTGYPILKYLGRVGDYHFLLTPDNQRRIIIGKDHWPALLLRSFNAPTAPDTASVHTSAKPA